MDDKTNHKSREIQAEDPKPPDHAGPNKISFFQRFIRATKDNQFYHRVIDEPARYGLIFFLQILLLATAIHGSLVLYRTIPEVNRVFDQVKEQIPTIEWADGSLKIDADLPYRIQVDENMIVILDPKATINRSRLDREVSAVLTNSGLYYRYSDGEFDFQSTREQFGDEWILTSQTIEDYRTTLLVLFVIITLGASGLLQLLTQAFRVLLITSGGWVLTRSQQPGGKKLLRISIHLLAPLFLIDWALSMVGLPLAAPAGIYEIALLSLGSYWIFRIYQEISTTDKN